MRPRESEVLVRTTRSERRAERERNRARRRRNRGVLYRCVVGDRDDEPEEYATEFPAAKPFHEAMFPEEVYPGSSDLVVEDDPLKRELEEGC